MKTHIFSPCAICTKLASGAALCLLLINSVHVHADRHKSYGSFAQKASNFLEPIKPKFTLSKKDPKQQSACRGSNPGECVRLLTYGGDSQGGIPTVQPSFEAYVPHARLDMVLQRVRISGHPMEPQDLDVGFSWFTKVDAITKHAGEEIGYHFVGSTDVTAAGYLHNSVVICSALILNGCKNFQTLTMSHHASMSTGASILPFEGEDSSTLDSTGYYNFNYSILVDAADDFSYSASVDLSGKVNVTCTAQAAL